MTESLESILDEQSKKLEQLVSAVTLLKSKECLAQDLIKAQNEAVYLKKGLDLARGDLAQMKGRNRELKAILNLVMDMGDEIKHMEANIPPELLQDYAKLQNSETENGASSNGERDTPASTDTIASNYSDNVFVENKENKVENCAKKLFHDSKAPFPKIEPIDKDEFTRIPKYMIGRQSISAINLFIDTINQILKNKYSLIALGKNGARKRGEFDLYMSYIKQEKTDSKENGRTYFFTAEDYLRHTKTKLDKTKLNLLTILRHCARLREVRSAKEIQYTLKNG